MKKYIPAFLYLTVGYWFISSLLPFALIVLPFATDNSGISAGREDGVATVRFHGSPGDVVFIATVVDSGDKELKYKVPDSPYSASSTTAKWDNVYVSIFIHIVFALISIPILKRLFQTKQGDGDNC